MASRDTHWTPPPALKQQEISREKMFVVDGDGDATSRSGKRSKHLHQLEVAHLVENLS